MLDAGIVLAIAYTGQGKPRPTKDYIDSLLAAGVGFMFIGESSATRSQEGYNAGVADAQHDNAAMDSVGYPAHCWIARAMSDQNRDVPGPGLIPQMAAYAQGYGEASRAPSWLAYGNVHAVAAALQGSTKCAGGWVPSSWAQGNQYHIIQEANLTAPIAQTDLNTIHIPFPWWGGTQGDDMGLDLTKAEDLTVWREAYYNQEGAWPTVENGVPVTIDYHKPVIMAKLDEILAGLSAGTGGGGTGLTSAQVRAIVRDELNKTKLAG